MHAPSYSGEELVEHSHHLHLLYNTRVPSLTLETGIPFLEIERCCYRFMYKESIENLVNNTVEHTPLWCGEDTVQV